MACVTIGTRFVLVVVAVVALSLHAKEGSDMATLNDLVGQIENAALRERIEEEIKRVVKQKKFGLVFEEHLPECTPLWEIPVKRGSLVAKKDGKMDDVWRVAKIKDGKAICVRDVTAGETNAVELELSDLVTVARFGEPIYPFLKPLGSVTNAPDNDLWHALIEADNYHALQFLEYIYGGKVDCIYIDPPYNTGAKDWKYNNNYVDDSDAYRHSKWLSMMQKRLALAKKLLNPSDSVLIVTIDEKEYLHLGCLLEEMFPESRIQMVSSVINHGGTVRGQEFSRMDEYLFFVKFGESSPMAMNLDKEWMGNISNTTKNRLRWRELIRHGDDGLRSSRPNLFYPIFVSCDGKRFMGCGDSIPLSQDRHTVNVPDGCLAIWPIHDNGNEGRWGYAQEGVLKLQKEGYLKLGRLTDRGMTISFLQPGQQERVKNGDVIVEGKLEDGSINVVSDEYEAKFVPGTQWNIKSHNASAYGSVLLQDLIGKRFSFPKSLYAVHDALQFFVANKPNAIIVDFFAGSGTTLHAVNLLNAVDGGKRQCVMVTNNEVSDAEAKSLTAQGYRPGDEEWERLGIARYVTWPRTVCSIEGHDVKGQPLKGNYGVEVDDYIVDEEDTVVSKTTGKPTKTKIYKKTKRQMYPKLAEMALKDYENLKVSDSSGEILYNGKNIKTYNLKAYRDIFATTFLKLGFLDKTSVSLGRQFREMLPTLWMKAGAHGPCPKVSGAVGDMLILAENKFAVLLEESAFRTFQKELAQVDGIETVYLVTDYAQSYKSMASALKGTTTYQLYRDYLDNFRINKGGR